MVYVRYYPKFKVLFATNKVKITWLHDIKFFVSQPLAFDVLMVRSETKKPVSVEMARREKSGQGRTSSGICVTCYNFKKSPH